MTARRGGRPHAGGGARQTLGWVRRGRTEVAVDGVVRPALDVGGVLNAQVGAPAAVAATTAPANEQVRVVTGAARSHGLHRALAFQVGGVEELQVRVIARGRGRGFIPIEDASQIGTAAVAVALRVGAGRVEGQRSRYRDFVHAARRIDDQHDVRLRAVRRRHGEDLRVVGASAQAQRETGARQRDQKRVLEETHALVLETAGAGHGVSAGEVGFIGVTVGSRGAITATACRLTAVALRTDVPVL